MAKEKAMEPHGLKPVAPPHASEGRNPPKHTLLRSFRASKGTLSAFIHGLRDRGFLRRRVIDTVVTLFTGFFEIRKFWG